MENQLHIIPSESIGDIKLGLKIGECLTEIKTNQKLYGKCDVIFDKKGCNSPIYLNLKESSLRL